MAWVPFVVALAVAAQGAAAPEASPPVSIERIQAALARPPALTVPATMFPPATFKVTISERQRFLRSPTQFDVESEPAPFGGLYYHELQQQLGMGLPWSQVTVGVPVLPMVHAIVDSISKWRYERAERAAREEVRRALAEFCAVHDCAAR